MVKLLNIDHPATFAISNHSLPYLATASVAGTVDVDFSNKASLQVYSSFKKNNNNKNKRNSPLVSVDIESKVYDLAWSADNSLLAGALESGVVQFYNADKLTNSESDSSSASDYIVHSALNHSAPVRALAFNNIRQNVLLSGSANNEIYIWDTNKLSAKEAPLTPTGTPYDTASSSSNSGANSAAVTSSAAKSDEINCLAWNNSISHIFASASTKGITSIWDLKSKKKVLNLNYLSTTQQGSNIRANLSSVVWHPSQSTKLVTVSDLDSLPVILQWELRFSKSPELIFGNALAAQTTSNSNTFSTNAATKGHTKGILSVAWNHADPDFLLTSGKDSQTLLWDMKSQDLVASYPLHAQKPATINAMDDYTNKRGEEWVFKTRFANKNPELFAVASYDGKVVLQTLQDTSSNRPDNSEVTTSASANSAAEAASAAKKSSAESETDFWNTISENDTSSGVPGTTLGTDEEIDEAEDIKPHIFIRKAPKWLSNPCGVKFAPFGNCFVQIKKSENGTGSQVIISKLKPDSTHSESLKDLKCVLSAGEDPNSAAVKDLVHRSIGLDKDFKLLLSESRLDLLKSITKEKDEEDKKDEDAAITSDEENIFDDIAASAADVTTSATNSYAPCGEFNLFSQNEKEDNLKSLLLQGNFSKFVADALADNMITEALIAALNSKDPVLLKKVLSEYFEQNKDNVLSRLLFNTSPTLVNPCANDSTTKLADNIDDLISNASISNWKDIIIAIESYTEADSEKFNNKLETLANRLHSANMREEAIKLYYISGSLSSLCSVWLEELKAAELKIISDSSASNEHKSYTDIYYSLVHHLLIKIFLFKHKLGISLTDNETFRKLNSLILDFANFAIDDDKELVKLLIASLPENFDGVKIIKIRINVSTEATVSATSRKKSVNSNRFPGGMNGGSSSPLLSSNRNKYMKPQQASNPYAPSIPASSNAQPPIIRMSSAYAPPPAGAVPGISSPKPSSAPLPPPPASSSKPVKGTHRARYVQTPQPATPAINGMGVNSNNNNPYAPQQSAISSNPVSHSSYVPQVPSAPAAAGVYTPQTSFGTVPSSNSFASPVAPPPIISNSSSGSLYSSSQNPSKAKKQGHEGWNDLPDAFAAVTSKATKRKAAPIATAPVITSMGSVTPGPGTPLSSKVLPPPPMGNSRRTSFASNTPPPSQQQPPQVNKYAPQTSTSAFNSPRMNSTSSFGTPPPQGSPYGIPPPQSNSYGAPPQGNSYGVPPQGNSYGAPPQGNSYGAPPQGNSYGAPTQGNLYGTPPTISQPQQVLAPPPQNGMSSLKSPTAEESIATEEAEAAAEAASAAPAKYPVGDRSHLSPEAKKIFNGLTMKLQYIKPQVPPKYAKKIFDTEKKLNILFDQMNNDELNDHILSLLQQLIDKLEAKDFAGAHAIHLDLGTNYTNEASSWFLGIKRVIDLLEAAS